MACRSRTVVCQLCGKSYTVTCRGKVKYCDSCKEQGYKQTAERHRITLSADTDAMRQLCLKCTRPRCGGECEDLARLARGEV